MVTSHTSMKESAANDMRNIAFELMMCVAVAMASPDTIKSDRINTSLKIPKTIIARYKIPEILAYLIVKIYELVFVIYCSSYNTNANHI